jgi:hypothetical protein
VSKAALATISARNDFPEPLGPEKWSTQSRHVLRGAMPLYDSSTSRTKFHACCCPTNSRRARSSNRSFTSSRLTALRHAANALTTPKLSMGVAQFCWSTFFGQFCCPFTSQPAKRAAVKSSEPHAV